MEKYGYVRISSKDQNTQRQLIALQPLDIKRKNLFADKQSGKDLLGTFVADLVLQVMSFVAEIERENIVTVKPAGTYSLRVSYVRVSPKRDEKVRT